MADSQYKRVDLRDKAAPEQPPGWNVRGGAPLEKAKLLALCKAQDRMLGGFRIVLAQHTGGMSGDWLVTTGDPLISATYPDSSTWRVMARVVTWITPGSDLECRALAIGSGSEGTDAQVEGAIRFSANYALGANTDSVSSKAAALPPSDEDYGDYGTSASWDWYHLHHAYLGKYRPEAPGYMNPAKRARWSEFAEATISIEMRAGARVISSNVSELPSYHSRAHDTDTSSAHAVGLDVLPGAGPQESQADGATYEERRYGTHCLLDVAERQASLLGPTIFQWSAYTEGLTAPGDAEAAPVSTTGTSFISMFQSSVTEWLADEPGFAIPTYYAELDHDVATLPNSSVAPVRLRVYHDTSVGATLRVQVTGRSWIDFDLPATSGYEWTTITGYLDADPAPDQFRANAQILIKHDSGGSLDLRYVSLHWGHT